jgi:hypothetical protein
MENILSNIYAQHRSFWSKRTLLLVLEGIVFFLLALVVQHIAYNYIDYYVAGTPVGDLLLNNLPTINLDIFIVQGALVVTFILLCLFIAYPKYLPFSLKSLAFFLITRSFFISLTHLGINFHQITLNQNSIGFGWYDFLYNAKNDFFFSGHVGATFLFGLIFFNKKRWRWLFFTASFIFGVSMILAHMHYSIDVFAAPFITYGIFVISKKIYKADYLLTQS